MTDETQVLSLPLEAIYPNPDQPRQQFDPVQLAELAHSLREHGLLQPVLVRPLGDSRYELIAGERRWQAAREAGLTSLPALVMQASPRRALELALVENLHRSDLTPLEEAEAYRGLMSALGLTQERLAERLGMSRVAVTNRLRLLSLTAAAREALADGRITEGHARALLGVQGVTQEDAVRLVEGARLSVRQTERLVRRLAAHSPRRNADGADAVTETLAEGLRRALGARVRARRLGAGVVVSLHFHSADAAYQMLEALGAENEDDL